MRRLAPEEALGTPLPVGLLAWRAAVSHGKQARSAQAPYGLPAAALPFSPGAAALAPLAAVVLHHASSHAPS